jgi:hypothetical protein
MENGNEDFEDWSFSKYNSNFIGVPFMLKMGLGKSYKKL